MSKKIQESKKMQDNKTPDAFAFPKAWTLFGPVGKDDPEPEFAGMTAIPKELTVAGKKLAGQTAAFTDHRLDLGALLGGKAEGKTAYLLAAIEVNKATEVEFGAGADWWMKWWVNGVVVCDTMALGNGNWPPSVLDHRFTARLKSGSNLVAVKAVSGSGGFLLAAGGPGGVEYTLVIKGGTVVDTDPPERNLPIYRRDHCRQNEQRYVEVERFISDTVVEY